MDMERRMALHALPSELFTLICHALGAAHTLRLSCASKPMRALALADAVWERHCQSELGLSALGVALWREHGGMVLGVAAPPKGLPSWFPDSLLACWHYFTFLHEALEIELMGEAKPCLPASGHWDGCLDVHLCLELANPWGVAVWTFFRACASVDADADAGVASSYGSGYTRVANEASAFVDGGGRLGLQASTVACVGYEATPVSSEDDCRSAVILSAAPLCASEEPRAVPPHLTHDGLLSLGWCPLDLSPDGMGGDDGGAPLAVPAVQAMLLPARASGDRLVVVGEHMLRVDAPVAAEAQRTGTFCFEVVQATGVGFDAGSAAPAVEQHAHRVELGGAAAHDLVTSAGAQVPHTRAPSRRIHVPHFDWEERRASEPEGGSDGATHGQDGGAAVDGRVLVVKDMPRGPPAVASPAALEMDVLRRTRVVVALPDLLPPISNLDLGEPTDP